MDPRRVSSIPLFADLNKRELEEVGRCADEVDVGEGRHLVEEGDFGYEFFAIEDGTADVCHDGERLAELGPGDFFGEVALSGEARRNASVIATSPMVAVVITRQAFRQLRNDIPRVCERIEAAVRERGRELAES
jgi:CRP/FNR family transcriptional regulator, cyclic AMP receptor protein